MLKNNMKNCDNASCAIIAPNNANASRAFPLFSFEALVTYDVYILTPELGTIFRNQEFATLKKVLKHIFLLKNI